VLRLAHQKKLDLRLFISPSHARQWETLHVGGLWTTWEDWKRQLVKINVEEASRAAAGPFPLWDFSGYTALTTEPFPALGDVASTMRWYWESSHYKKQLGDLVLDRVFDYRDPSRELPGDFGIRLDPATIEAHLAWIRAGRERWVAQYPDDANEIAQVAAMLRRNQVVSAGRNH
jgi:hypothetical protein